MTSRRVPAGVRAAAAGFMLAGAVAACGSTMQYANCVDNNGRIVDANHCNDNGTYPGGTYWIWMANRHYSVGSTAPSSWRSSRINPTDQNARAKAGLPRTGSVAGKTVTRGGGLGSGSDGHGTGEGGHAGTGHGAGS